MTAHHRLGLVLVLVVLVLTQFPGAVDSDDEESIDGHAEVFEDVVENVTHVDGSYYNNSDGYNLSLPSDFQPLLGGPGGARAGAKDHHGEGEEGEHAEGGPEHEECELAVASFDWANVQNPMIIATFLFFSALTKISFHHAGFLVTKVPESCLLIILGTICGTIFTFTTDAETFPEDLKTLRPELFFMVLLPPIVLEASYSLHDRVFFDNLGSILVFAVIGTVTSCFFIGPVLYGLSYAGALPGGDKISFIHCMLFASIIVAVDPVAVLAIFQEIGVNSVLYFLVFGESLLNDAVTLVLYHTVEGMNCFMEEGQEITASMYVIALLKFFATSFGGILIGMFFGALTSLLTKYTVETRVIEPLILFSLAYLSWVSSELFHFSGIVGLTMCGLIQAQYAFHNISHKSYVTVKYFTKMASNASDSVIFLYLGLNLVRLDHEWHTGFIIATVLLTLIGRFIITYGLSRVVNTLRLRQITHREQFIMAYGGLRGAVAFSLVSLLTGKLDQKIQSMFMTTTLVVIIFTVFVQGGTIKPLVSLLDIRKQNKEEKLHLFTELNSNVTDHVMAGIEEIVGKHGQFFFYDWLIHLDDKYIKHKLQRNPLRKDEKIMKLYEKIALKQHFANLKGCDAAEKYIKKSISAIEGPQPIEDSVGSLHPAVATMARHHPRASLLSQLTRFGDIEEPEHVDDIAYVTPDMLEDELPTSVQRKKFQRQQSVITNDLTSAQQFRLLLTQPGSSMDARELRSDVDMDDRSNLMYQLQEKNKRLERFKRSIGNVAPDNSLYSVVQAAMTPIPEGRGGQIVRKIGVGRQGSMMKQVWQRAAAKTFADIEESDIEKQKRLQRLHSMRSLEDEENAAANSAKGPQTKDQPTSTSDKPTSQATDKPVKKGKSKDKLLNKTNNSNTQPQNRNNNSAGSPDDSVFIRQKTDELEMKLLAQEKEVQLQDDQDIEQGRGDSNTDQPLAQSSQDSDWFKPLPTVRELSEVSSHPSGTSLPLVGARGTPISSSSPRDDGDVVLSMLADESGDQRQSDVNDEDVESETWDPEKEVLVKRSQFQDGSSGHKT